MRRLAAACVAAAAMLAVTPAAAQTTLSGEQIRIARATAPIAIDGDLSDEGWRGASRVDRWYETTPGDNGEPGVGSVGYLTYDDRFLYVGFELDDPDPAAIRAPLADHDNVPDGSTDWAGVYLDTRNDGHSAMIMLATPRGVHYDALIDDAACCENPSADFFWDSAARINGDGWTLEMRIPFSTLRYAKADPQTWGIMLRRNYPREFLYQLSSTRVPRGSNCLVCRANMLVGLERLPAGGHIVAAPYVSGSSEARPRAGLGSPLAGDSIEPDAGFDLKWSPNADNVVDATVRPDFSQVESDTAQISTNERFALFFPERRAFFLEGASLLSTPINAVHTRTITAPRWGGRSTGQLGPIAYTVLAANDAGGGTVVLPGPRGSSFAPQAFDSHVIVGRLKWDIGRSFVGALVSDRGAGANGHNRVAGPDFQWRPNDADVITGQLLVSDTRTPDRPELTPEWTGRRMTSPAGSLEWSHSTTHFDSRGTYRDFGDDFRAETGFVSQVGFRELSGFAGWTVRPGRLASRVRPSVTAERTVDRSGEDIFRSVTAGVDLDTRSSGYVAVRYNDEQFSTGTGPGLIGQRYLSYHVHASPSRRISSVAVSGTAGGMVDFANARPGSGSSLNVEVAAHLTDHLELALLNNQQRLTVDDPGGSSQRLFTASVQRARAMYMFNARTFLRVIAQHTATDRDPALYGFHVDGRSGDFSGSVLVGYKLNWQSVLFVGYGTERELMAPNGFQPSGRQFFTKISYAFQR